MNKEPRKAIMTRTCLVNKYRKDNSAGNLFSYKGQRNLCVKLLRKSRKDFYNNKKCWQTVQMVQQKSSEDKPRKDTSHKRNTRNSNYYWWDSHL